MIHEQQSPTKTHSNLSSDEQYQNQKPQTPLKRRQNNGDNDDVIDEKEEVRQVSVKVENEEEEILHQLIKEEYLEEMEGNKEEEMEIESEKQIVEEVVSIDTGKNENETIQTKQGGQSVIPKQQLKQEKENEKKSKSPQSKLLTKSTSSTSANNKYLQPNSPQLFISPQSLLPNQIICIQNNSTRVIVHMNKKIVPIPSSFTPKTKSQSSPQRSRATLPSVQCPYLLGKFIVTNYKLIYMDSLYPNTMTFCLPLNYLFKIERTHQQSTGVSFVELWFKTGLSVKLKYPQEEYNYSQKIKDIVMTLMHKNLYAAMDLGGQESMQQLLCKSYCERYFAQVKVQKEIKGLQAEIIDNKNWEEMTGYPQKYIVPFRYIGKRNTQTRLVILSYIYSIHNEKITLWRTGPGLPDPTQDQWIPKSKFSPNHYVIQVKNKGIGISKTQASKQVELQTLYLLRQSFQKVHQLFYHNHDSMKWLGNLCGTRWYEQVATLMNEALNIIQVMSQKTNVTLVCDTQGRGAQITAIVQLLMNPFYRTFDGFPELIEKEFLHYGCPKPGKKQREEDKSIILIQFLDCVYQFTHLYPLSFEFSEHYLVFLAEHVYSNKYGNFLYITRQLKKFQESDRRQVQQKCVCIWQDIKQKMQNDKHPIILPQQQPKKPMQKKPSIKKSPPPIHETITYSIYFRNSFYIDHNQSNIFELRNHSQVSKGIRLWSGYFSKKVYCAELVKEQVLFCNQIEKRYFKIGYEHVMMKKYNEVMRKKLAEQYAKIAEKKNVIKSLKEL